MSALLKTTLGNANRRAYDNLKNGMTFLRTSMAAQSRRKSDSVLDSEHYQSMEARTVQFSPSRTRDHSGAAIEMQEAEKRGEKSGFDSAEDEHVESYDAHGSISLNSVMQSMVPEPYTTQGKRAPTHLNMPGGHVGQDQKFLSDHLQNVHYSRNNRELHTSAAATCYIPGTSISVFNNQNVPPYRGFTSNTCTFCSLPSLLIRNGVKSAACNVDSKSYTTKPGPVVTEVNDYKLSAKEKLKRAVKDYGATVVVFHVGISLMSLGGFYTAVSSGLDVVNLLQSFGITEVLAESKLAAGASTFVVAYAVHKVFAPARIGITLTATPFIVRYLRKIGFLKPPKAT